jgi:hypothetical protein
VRTPAGAAGSDDGPVTTSERLLRALPVALLLALPAWALGQNDQDDCRDIGQCLVLSLDQVVYLLLAGWPLMWLALRGLSVPRAFLAATATALLACLTWTTAHQTQDALFPPTHAEPTLTTISLAATLSAAAVATAVATVAVGPGGRVALRVLLPAVLVVLAPAVGAWQLARAEQQRASDVVELGVTSYQPRIAGEVAEGRRRGDLVRLHYSLGEGARFQSVTVTLSHVETTGDLCSLVGPQVRAACTTEDGTMRAVHGEWTEVAVVRGETVLHADTFRPEVADADELLDALRTAPRVTPRELVRWRS